jgi:hypothetical protein
MLNLRSALAAQQAPETPASEKAAGLKEAQPNAPLKIEPEQPKQATLIAPDEITKREETPDASAQGATETTQVVPSERPASTPEFPVEPQSAERNDRIEQTERPNPIDPIEQAAKDPMRAPALENLAHPSVEAPKGIEPPTQSLAPTLEALQQPDPPTPPTFERPAPPAWPERPEKQARPELPVELPDPPQQPEDLRPVQPEKPQRPELPPKPEPPETPVVERPERPAPPAKPERPDGADRPEKPEKPEKPDKPDKPDKPERPGKQDKPQRPEK